MACLGYKIGGFERQASTWVCWYAQLLGLDGYAAVLRVGLGPTTPP
jgi:hypothetical protein